MTPRSRGSAGGHLSASFRSVTLFPFPYGYKWNLFAAGLRQSIKYKVPLFYPDWEAPFGVTYLKRVQGRVFGDYVNSDIKDPMIAVGAGITFELAGFFDIKFPLSITSNYYYPEYYTDGEYEDSADSDSDNYDDNDDESDGSDVDE